jgi:hypothetical protein
MNGVLQKLCLPERASLANANIKLGGSDVAPHCSLHSPGLLQYIIVLYRAGPDRSESLHPPKKCGVFSGVFSVGEDFPNGPPYAVADRDSKANAHLAPK